MKKAEEIAARLEATIELAMKNAAADLKGVDIEEVADALYDRVDERIASQIMLKIRR